MRKLLFMVMLGATALAGCGQRQAASGPARPAGALHVIADDWPPRCPRRQFDVVEWIPPQCNEALRPIERPDLLGLDARDRRYAWFRIGSDAYYLACRDKGCFIKAAVYDRFANVI